MIVPYTFLNACVSWTDGMLDPQKGVKGERNMVLKEVEGMARGFGIFGTGPNLYTTGYP